MLKDTGTDTDVYIDEVTNGYVRVMVQPNCTCGHCWTIDEYRGSFDDICLGLARAKNADIIGVKAA